MTEKQLAENICSAKSKGIGNYDLKKHQSLDLFDKIKLTRALIIDYHKKYGGNVTISFSGGLDSEVLLHNARSIFPDIKAVFSDTGLEYPEIRAFVKTFDNVDIVKPKMRFDEVIKKYGYPVISKRVSRDISDLQNPTPKNERTRNLRLTGISNVTNPGKYQPSMKLPEKWKFLIDAPFKISDKCCDMLKKEPLNRYEKQHGTKRIIGIMADQSDGRARQAREYGTETGSYLAPMIFWTRQDVLRYIRFMGVPHCSVYGEIIDKPDGTLDTTGEHRTGCMFCMFGVHLEKRGRTEPYSGNRFQRMKKSHPNQHKYCMENLGCAKVLEFIGVEFQ
jgi:3'-phosphoadenosine 5'-phosphosulfate sulfotransferase (PAPS reductase)/FAD synthetase